MTLTIEDMLALPGLLGMSLCAGARNLLRLVADGETLDALLQENGNTLKQRIQRIEHHSGQSLDDPLFRMNASVALLMWRMTEAQRQDRT
ncbi:hypothetical protein AWM69_03945 [Pseudomonas sp. D1HM]|nr:hypothetical protein [Pseudomonas sp. D1HM]